MSTYWEVTAIKYQGPERPWKVWWATNEVTQEPLEHLDGIDRAFLEHATINRGEVIILNITHLMDTGTRWFAKTTTHPDWKRIERVQVLPLILTRFEQLPVEQRKVGAGLVTTTESEFGCCPYSVLSLFSELLDYSDRFDSFNYGAVRGDFVQWLHRRKFGEHMIIAERLRLRNDHPLDYLTQNDRLAGEKFLLQISSNHMVGVELVQYLDDIVGVIHCSQNPGTPLLLNLEHFKLCGGSLEYRGRIWRLLHAEDTY